MRSIFFVLISMLMTTIIIPMILIQSCDLSTPKVEKQEFVESQRMVHVFIHETKTVEEIELEEYVKGVIAGEMPASFEIEALKAQAVAARSYAISRVNQFRESGNPNHPQAELCDSVHCQVWYSKDKLREVKSKYWMRDYWPRIEAAVDETRGMIMTYNTKPVDQPLFHSTSGGRTENSEDVFVSAVPYLRSVNSPYEEKAPYLTDRQTVKTATFVSKVKGKYKDCDIKESTVSSAVKILEKSEGGRIMKIQVGNKVLTGREIRDLLGLRSANFTVSFKGNEIEFTTVGYGHGVGMSQWGANGMAERGHSYEEILKHYYQGVEIEPLNQ
ncbi:stage II sporulation protein D [Geosporobacter ferrireducens]|uniref:Stage II sporulation protein D n=1 Tax=Geosporobacter ferrireducens TaxID=1424294 RepID=A0A1D8GGR3_9FIRM|nr:stage II sporulation protein D [Geosporobacter ferrireducens]AOT70063.1 stage II sporulation protein D [Geosporobacter ferrireducens]MTI53389.1 stage II sporulation protein D [Geosporobacter ferrireducens]